jgi:prepilin signal peptidase PulO-like enzyme (type II secretory pathway)
MQRRLFIILILITGTNRLLEAGGFFIPFVHSWLDDVLCLPVVLYAMLFIFRNFLLFDNAYSFPVVYIAGTVALYSFVFEYYLPKYTHRFTADIDDVICYAVGGLIFYLFLNRKEINFRNRLVKSR